MGAVITRIAPGSPASKTIISVGDRLVKINGHDITDVLDYKFYSYDSRLHLVLSGAGGRLKLVTLRKGEGVDPGMEFETPLMDTSRSCANNCIFCFVDQMPSGMRDTLYYKDDDARLSFLQGTYITLTNLSEREVQRIIDLRISPINISVHSTDAQLRALLLGNKNGGRGLDAMRRFADAGIVMNCQIVCCPGINDGDALDKSMADLAMMLPAVNSVSIVPVGLTKYRSGLHELQPYEKDSAAEVIRRVESFSETCMQMFDSRVFFCSDEFYIKAGRELPCDVFYEDYPQLENGVGMMRLLMTEFEEALEPGMQISESSFTIATGVSAAPFLETLMYTLAQEYDTIKGNVVPIKNTFFGETIDVAGLITGGDMIEQLKGQRLGDRLLIPRNMLRHGETVFLDDVTIEQLESGLGVTVRVVEQDGADLLSAMTGH